MALEANWSCRDTKLLPGNWTWSLTFQLQTREAAAAGEVQPGEGAVGAETEGGHVPADQVVTSSADTIISRGSGSRSSTPELEDYGGATSEDPV